MDGCVDVLLDDVEEMIELATSVDVTGIIPAPWPSLREVRIILIMFSHCKERNMLVGTMCGGRLQFSTEISIKY